MNIIPEVAALDRDMRDWRHHLHAHPETAFEETATAAYVADKLKSLGLEVHTGLARTGVVGVLRNGQSQNAIGLRADLDALHVHERTNASYTSRNEGKMHACGHDGHTTMLLGAARYLAATRRFSGTVFLIFQPGEEGFAGGKAMVEEGLFERFPADEIYALHNWPALPPGTIAVRPGPMMAAADRIEIHIEGRGGHGAHPHMSVDPVLVAGHVITAAQSIVARNVSPVDTAVVSLCAMHAGNLAAMSVIPRDARLVGTVRTFKPQTQDAVERRLSELTHSIAAAFGAKATLKYERVYPATVNSEREAEFAASVADELIGPENVVRDLEPSMGSEDFSFMLQQRPGAYARLGQGGAEGGCFLHNSRYDFNDEVIPVGAGYLAALAEQALSR